MLNVVGNSAGTFVNVTDDLTSSSGNSGSATDTLTVQPLPGFTKGFNPNSVAMNEVSTLTFTIDNTGSTVDATDLDFIDNFPNNLVVANPSNAVTTCTGGTVTATVGASMVSYTSGTVSAGNTCTVRVDVTSDTTDTYVNISGDLTSSLGNSGTATDTLVVEPPLTLSKHFGPETIPVNGTSTLTFTLDNSASNLMASNLAFTDTLPSSLVIASPANTVNTCTEGRLPLFLAMI